MGFSLSSLRESYHGWGGGGSKEKRVPSHFLFRFLFEEVDALSV